MKGSTLGLPELCLESHACGFQNDLLAHSTTSLTGFISELDLLPGQSRVRGLDGFEYSARNIR